MTATASPIGTDPVARADWRSRLDTPGADILAIPVGRPDRLFTGHEHPDISLKRGLLARWHPDKHGGAAEAERVFQHVNALWAARVEQLAGDAWRGGGTFPIALLGGGTLSLRYNMRAPFDDASDPRHAIGTRYQGDSYVAYHVTDGAAIPRMQRALAQWNAFPYGDARLEAEVSRYLPRVRDSFLCADGSQMITLHATPELVHGRVLLDAFEGHLPIEHVCWVMTRLSALCVYFEITGITHNAIDLDAIFISPPHHTVLLLGSWWYTRRVNEVMTELPQWASALWRSLVPPSAVAAKQATNVLDLESVRRVGRTLLGDVGGTKILHDPSIPKPIAQWLTTPPRGTALEEMQRWERVRDSVFARKFIPLVVPR